MSPGSGLVVEVSHNISCGSVWLRWIMLGSPHLFSADMRSYAGWCTHHFRLLRHLDRLSEELYRDQGPAGTQN